MEDCVFEEMVDYSSDSLERVFSTMGELAPIGINFAGMEQQLGQQVEVRVPSSPDNKVIQLTGGEQLFPNGIQNMSSTSPLLSVGFPVSTRLWETPALQLPGSLNTDIFSQVLEITGFPVSSSILTIGFSSFPSQGLVPISQWQGTFVSDYLFGTTPFSPNLHLNLGSPPLDISTQAPDHETQQINTLKEFGLPPPQDQQESRSSGQGSYPRRDEHSSQGRKKRKGVKFDGYPYPSIKKL